MSNYGKRFLIVFLLAICIGLLFIGGRQTHAHGHEGDNKAEWAWPCEGTISDLYGTRNGKHKGIDIAGKLNDPIKSVEKGIVTKSYYSNTYGNVVFIKHADQKETVYAHLEKRLVSNGQKVTKDQKIGLMGNTGQSYGVHLHFEVHQDKWTVTKENALDPLLVMAEMNTSAHLVTTASKEIQIIAEEKYKQTTLNTVNKQENKVPDTSFITYKVKKGDTLSEIAKTIGGSVKTIKEKNGLTSDFIKVDQVLKIPSDQKLRRIEMNL